MKQISFNDAIVIIKQSIKNALLTLNSLPDNSCNLGFSSQLINRIFTSSKPNKKPINPKDIDFMDKVLFNFFDNLSKDEKYLAFAYALNVKRKIIADKLNLSRQSVHNKYLKVIEKIAFNLFEQNYFKTAMLSCIMIRIHQI